jgi:hypothetical protein
MVSSKDMLKLIEITHALDLDGLHFIGDRQQLSAIEQGKSFALAQAHGAPIARMDENLRQKGSPLLTAVAGLTNEGFASKAIELLNAHNLPRRRWASAESCPSGSNAIRSRARPPRLHCRAR